VEVPDEESADARAGTVEPAPPRRFRTTSLVAVAAVLGVLAGTGAGYLVQSGREPRMPALGGPELPRAQGPQPEPLSAERDRKVRNDGDLRELLLRKPGGASTPDWVEPQGWMDLAAYAEMREDPESAYDRLEEQEFLRAAVTGWSADGDDVEIWLAQFEQREDATGPADDSGGARYWAETDPDVRTRPIPGTGEGKAYVHPKPVREAGGAPFYTAEAHASRGDLSLHIWVYGDDPIPWRTIMDLAERQMERL
jgi:hypothetical protein